MSRILRSKSSNGEARPLASALAVAALLTAAMMFPAFSAPAAANCEAVVADFNSAAEAGRDKAAQAAIDKVAANADCGGLQAPMQRRLAALRLASAQRLMAQGRPPAEFEAALAAAEKQQVLWQASATLAGVRFDARAFAEAAQAYDRAIELVKNEALTPVAPAMEDIQRLLDRGAQARLLAANQTPAGVKGSFVKTASNAAGGLGGVYSSQVRGIVPRAVPMPITFDYRSAELTPVGMLAAKDLLRAIQEQNPEKIRIVGHTDPRGGPDYNSKLSKARADAVAAFLKENGITIAIETEGRGADEPLKIEASAGLSADDLNALNRRVEWRRE